MSENGSFPESLYEDYITLENGNIINQWNLPNEYNGYPIERRLTKVGLIRLPKKVNVVNHPTGLKLCLCPKGYVILCIESNCERPGCRMDIKCTKHATIYSYCELCPSTPRFGVSLNKPLRCLQHKENNMYNVTEPKCGAHKCTKKATFGHVLNRPLRCKDHIEAEMFDVVHKKCEYPNCTKQPSLGYSGKRLRCKEHAETGMLDVAHKKCEYPGCLIRCIFGYFPNKPLNCVKHKQGGMLDVMNKKCTHLDCFKNASFGFELDGASKCGDHRQNGMINVVSKRCEYIDCIIQATFGYNLGKPLNCKAHKKYDMIDVVSKQCSHPECTKHPIFGRELNNPLRCKKHKDNDMIDVANKRCEHFNCIKQATYGHETNKPLKCRIHKENDMINVRSKKCGHEGCLIIPLFGYTRNETLFCETHKKHGMTNIISKRCKYPNCEILPSYGKLYTKSKIYCISHTTLNDYSYLKSNPVCTNICCTNTAYYFSNENNNIYPVRCEIHKLSQDLQLINKQCLKCLDSLYIPLNQTYCMECGQYRIKKLYKFKEHYIKDFLVTNNIQFVHNRCISPKGSKFRPDFIIRTKLGYLIIEVDEHQHLKRYSLEKEISRMRTIYADAQLDDSKTQVIFIRYNPDKYDSAHQFDTKSKLKYLYDLICHFTNIENSICPLSVVYLFYNGYKGFAEIAQIYI